jgi:hypothetical protein
MNMRPSYCRRRLSTSVVLRRTDQGQDCGDGPSADSRTLASLTAIRSRPPRYWLAALAASRRQSRASGQRQPKAATCPSGIARCIQHPRTRARACRSAGASAGQGAYSAGNAEAVVGRREDSHRAREPARPDHCRAAPLGRYPAEHVMRLVIVGSSSRQGPAV